MRKHYTGAQRTTLIELVTTGRSTPLAAATQLGVAESTAYYWLKQARRRPPPLAVSSAPRAPAPARGRASAVPTFVRLVRAPQAPSAITLHVGSVAKIGRWRSPKSEQADHRKRSMVIAENGDGDRWSDHSVTGWS